MSSLLLGLLACAKHKAPAPELSVVEEAAEVARRTPIEAGRYWSEPGGLCLEVPAGWRGSSGPAPHVLSLVHDDSGVGLDVFAWPLDARPSDDRPGWVLVFSDDDSYRAVPILTPSGTASWRLDADTGPTITAWRAELGGRWVAIEATLPYGAATSGLSVVEPVLRGLCTTFR